MSQIDSEPDSRVAVLADCENTDPDILEYALRVAAQFGRVVLRRGFGNHSALAHKWQEVLVKQAFTPCLQYTYAPGKNTSDIALWRSRKLTLVSLTEADPSPAGIFVTL